MSDERYPADLVLTNQDFADCGWREALAASTREGYLSMWSSFSGAARKAIDENRQSHGKALWLLADACSMRLFPKSINDPFKPIMMLAGKRSVIPEDLPENDISFYAQIVDGIDDPWLKARLADLVWLKKKPRDVGFALSAIDAYRSIPLTVETWLHDGRDCWERAVVLSLMLNKGADKRLEEIESAILSTIDTCKAEDGFLALWLSDLLFSKGLGRAHRSQVALKLEQMGQHFDAEGDLHRARDYFRAAGDWYKAEGNDSKAAEMTVALAEGFVKEAISRTAGDNPSHMVANSFYENAIQTYRTIPRGERGALRVDERITELRAHLNESGEMALGELGLIRTPGVDINELIGNAREAVRGKSVPEALAAFASLYLGANANKIRESSIRSLGNHPLSSLFPATVVSRDGRVIARKPGISLDGNSPDDEIAIRAQMVKEYDILMRIVVSGDIWPALEVLLQEHQLHETDFVGLASQSPIVPKGRESLFGKALYAGYERDFVMAIHLLVPQIEHMVRYHLKQAGAKTTNLDSNGIENENGLSTLMELPEAALVFGEDLAFEIKALFCDPFGPNLRNQLAHGLLEEGDCQTYYAIYAWWFALRIVFISFWNAAAKSKDKAKDTAQDGEEYVE